MATSKVSKSAILAGAALAVPMGANADVIFNPTQVNIQDATYNLDLDGAVNDFLFTALGADTVTPLGSNGYVGTATNNPTPLSSGALINSGSLFQTGAGTLQEKLAIQKGPWPTDNSYAYLGVEFLIGSDLHYGWVNLSASACNPGPIGCTGSLIRINGWAYEGDVGKGIAAGAGQVPEPSTLPLLALGAAGLAAFRARRKRAA